MDPSPHPTPSPIRHFTASAFVINSNNQVLLLDHKRLGKWMPPGGHMEENETPEEAAARECKEETGLDVEIIGQDQEDVFAGSRGEGRILKIPINMLLENIPAYGEEPAHQHMDFVFLARPIDEEQVITMAEEEAHDMRWFTREEVEQLGDDEIFGNVKMYALSVLE